MISIDPSDPILEATISLLGRYRLIRRRQRQHHQFPTEDGSTWTGSTSTTTHSDDTISAVDVGNLEEWTCTVTPNDGDTNGASASVSLTTNCTGWDWNNDGVVDICANPVLAAPLNDAGNDISDSAHTATENGSLSYGTDRCGTDYAALSFDGSSYITFPDSSDFSFGSGDYSISLWSNATNTTAAIISQWATSLYSGGGGDDAFFLAYLTHQTEPLFMTSPTTALETSTWTSPPPFPQAGITGRW